MPLLVRDGEWIVDATRQYHYVIAARRGIIQSGAADLLNREGVEKWLVVIDAKVHDLYRAEIRRLLDGLDGEIHILELPISESRKVEATVDEIITATLDADLSRRDGLLGIGGGIVADMVGYAAAKLRKETRYCLVSTTLVGDGDADLGFKRMVNFRYQPKGSTAAVVKKSLVGDYHPPRVVIIDPDFLRTLPEIDLRSGIAEIKKVAEMASAKLFRHLEQHGNELIKTGFQGETGDVALSLAISGILEQLASDPWEAELRRWPDHGHSISPTLEMETGLPHGLTVNICASVGAAVANARTERGRKLLADEPFARMLDLSADLGLPIWHPKLAEPGFLARAAGATALVRAGNHWPVPVDIGAYTFIEPTLAELQAASDLLRDQTEGN